MTARKFSVTLRRDNCTCKSPDRHILHSPAGPNGGGPLDLEVCLACFRYIGHPVHTCLACSEQILPFEEEVSISTFAYRATPQGGGKQRRGYQSPRYRHRDDRACRDAMAHRKFRSPPWPKRTGASRAAFVQEMRDSAPRRPQPSVTPPPSVPLAEVAAAAAEGIRAALEDIHGRDYSKDE